MRSLTAIDLALLAAEKAAQEVEKAGAKKAAAEEAKAKKKAAAEDTKAKKKDAAAEAKAVKKDIKKAKSCHDERDVVNEKLLADITRSFAKLKTERDIKLVDTLLKRVTKPRKKKDNNSRMVRASPPNLRVRRIGCTRYGAHPLAALASGGESA